MTVEEAYRVCREIAQREAKNFYYAFRVLPRAKRDAMCAVYAFMRRADDLADDESLTIAARRLAMDNWLAAWRSSRTSPESADPVFLALSDTQRRFGIADGLLEDLVRGTTLDLDERPDGVATVPSAGKPFEVYESFESLKRYCYLVASVVGLVCIRVFGYRDGQAERLAEETGLAFQMTNILRDVREDAERGRIYLPLEDMAAAGTGVEEVLGAVQGSKAPGGVGALMHMEGERARRLYGAADRLLPLIERDSRAALWVMVTIYRELLERIATAGYPITGRISVPRRRKLWILGRGICMAVWLRVSA